MTSFKAEEHVLPRPVERLPEYAHAAARKALAERLSDSFELPEAVAAAIANAVVDPAAVRKSIGDPTDPEVERIPVPGGFMLGIRTQVWARKVMPDARNPRTLPKRRHPFAVDPGTGGDDSKFRPVPEPKPLVSTNPQLGALEVELESRHQLNWASQLAKTFVLSENDWRDSIAYQGVMEAVWLVTTTYTTKDGTASGTALTTAEGSSRLTAVHDLLGIRSADVPWEANEPGFRGAIRKANQMFDIGEGADHIAMRCERIPALILLGFKPHQGSTTGFPTAVKSLVALRHVDPPTPWGEGPENESLADEVLDEMYRRDLISETQRNYYAGSCTRTEAAAAHLSVDPAVRAASIVRLLCNPEQRFVDAIRMAVTSQSTRKRISPKLLFDLATALVLRAIAEDPAKTDQVRRYLRHAFAKSVHRENWQSTDRGTDQLVKDAQAEVAQAVGTDASDEPGPASLELAVRAAYALVVSGRLNADRGTANNDQPDRRTPGEVLNSMRLTPQGVYQLGQALIDFASGVPIRAVDENGQIQPGDNGAGEKAVNDVMLRGEYPPPGKSKTKRPGDTPQDHFENRISDFSRAMDVVEKAFLAIGEVNGDDGRPLVETRGVDHRSAEVWRTLIRTMDDDLLVWSRAFKRAFGSGAKAPAPGPAEGELDDLLEIESQWDRAAESGS